MAYIRKSGNKALVNALLAGFKGSFGDLTIRQYKNKIVLSAKAGSRRKKKPTAKQAARQLLFQEAVIYGRRVNKDPKKKAYYSKRLKGKRNAYQAAVSAYIKTGGRVGI
jgi:hypothetical protein